MVREIHHVIENLYMRQNAVFDMVVVVIALRNAGRNFPVFLLIVRRPEGGPLALLACRPKLPFLVRQKLKFSKKMSS